MCLALILQCKLLFLLIHQLSPIYMQTVSMQGYWSKTRKYNSSSTRHKVLILFLKFFLLLLDFLGKSVRAFKIDQLVKLLLYSTTFLLFLNLQGQVHMWALHDIPIESKTFPFVNSSNSLFTMYLRKHMCNFYLDNSHLMATIDKCSQTKSQMNVMHNMELDSYGKILFFQLISLPNDSIH